jgi:Putative Flp pilus-assembly TadE/G-like
MLGRSFSRRTQQGQALVMTVLFGAVAGLALLLIFNSSLLVNTKSQLQNAADAGAYTAGLLQARDHNFSAYTNRAMIANQVAVAQFVSLESYFEDAANTNNRMSNFAHTFVRNLVPAFAPQWDAAKQIPMSSIQSSVSAISTPAIIALNLLIDAFDTAQEIHHTGTAVDMFLVADEVVKKNDPQAKITTSTFMAVDAVARVKAWNIDYTKRHSANDASAEADRFADAVVRRDSNDGFTQNRFSVPTLAWWFSYPNATACIGGIPILTGYEFNHFGSTLLSNDKKKWRGLDATMGAGFVACEYLIGPFPVTVVYPLPDVNTSFPFFGGSGGAMVGNGSGYEGESFGYKNNPWETKFYGLALTSPAAVPAWARFWAGPNATLDSNGGIQDHYRDIADPKKKPKNQSADENGGKFPVTIEVERSANTINTTSKLLPGSNRLKLEDANKGATMRTIATAHAFFYRSNTDSQFTRNGWRRGDGKTEYENLFSPYWQARLAPSSALEEAGSLAAQ